MALKDLLNAIVHKKPDSELDLPGHPLSSKETPRSPSSPVGPSAKPSHSAADESSAAPDPALSHLAAKLAEISQMLDGPGPAAAPDPAPASTPAPAAEGSASVQTAPAPVDARTKDISLYKNLLAGLYDGVLIFDEKGSVIGSNHRAETFLGYTEADLWGMSCESLIVGINARILYKLNANAEAGRFTVVSGVCKRQDGTTFAAEIAISKIKLLHAGDLIFSIRNMERRETAREGREYSEDAVRHNGSGIVICTTEGAIVFANPAFLKLLKMEDEQEALKHMIGDFCDSHEQVKAMIHGPSSQGTWLGKLRLVSPKGVSCEVLVTAALSTLRRNSAAHLVLNMTPLPKSIA